MLNDNSIAIRQYMQLYSTPDMTPPDRQNLQYIALF